MDNVIPKKIYLEWYDEDGKPHREGSEEVTWCEDIRNADDIEYHHVSEVERLRREKEWQLNQIIEYKIQLFFDSYGLGNEGRLNALKETEEEMQQALNEESIETTRKYDNKGGPI